MMSLGIVENEDGGGDGLEAEIARAAHPLIQRTGGAILLEEVYCAVNRARGVKMVAPDEIHQAAKKIQHTYPQGGCAYHCYPSGVKVLKDATVSDQSIADKIVSLMLERESLSVSEYALESKLTPIVAKEQLLMTELMGAICRDESDRGTYFFINKLLCT